MVVDVVDCEDGEAVVLVVRVADPEPPPELLLLLLDVVHDS